MTLFGTVNSFDIDKGHGSIKQEAGGMDLGFERGAISWDAEGNSSHSRSASIV